MAHRIGISTAVVLLVLSSTLTLGCEGHGGDSQQVAINQKNLIGNWEVASISVDGMTVPAKMESPANEAGYKDSFEKLQYQITDTKFRMINSDELSVTFMMENDYILDHNKVVPQAAAGESQAGFEVISLSANTMTVKPSGLSQPANLQFNLVRINESEVATNKFKPIDQNISFRIQAPSLDLSDSIAVPFPETVKIGDTVAFSCRYMTGQLKGLAIELSTYHNGNGTISASSADLGMNLLANAHFDFSKPAEEINVALTTTDSTYLNGVYSKDSTQAGFALGTGGTCAVNVKRVKRRLNVTSTCSGMVVTPNAGPGNSSNGTFNLNAACVLRF